MVIIGLNGSKMTAYEGTYSVINHSCHLSDSWLNYKKDERNKNRY